MPFISLEAIKKFIFDEPSRHLMASIMIYVLCIGYKRALQGKREKGPQWDIEKYIISQYSIESSHWPSPMRLKMWYLPTSIMEIIKYCSAGTYMNKRYMFYMNIMNLWRSYHHIDSMGWVILHVKPWFSWIPWFAKVTNLSQELTSLSSNSLAC